MIVGDLGIDQSGMVSDVASFMIFVWACGGLDDTQLLCRTDISFWVSSKR